VTLRLPPNALAIGGAIAAAFTLAVSAMPAAAIPSWMATLAFYSAIGGPGLALAATIRRERYAILALALSVLASALFAWVLFRTLWSLR
jgi:hypothetical protein